MYAARIIAIPPTDEILAIIGNTLEFYFTSFEFWFYFKSGFGFEELIVFFDS